MEQHLERKLRRQAELFEQPSGEETKALYYFFLPQTADTIRPELRPENKQQRIDWAKRKYEYEMEISRILDDDYIPSLDVASSTAIFPEAFGAEVFYPKGDMPCGRHFISTPEQSRALKVPKLEDSSLMYYFDIADELYRFGGKDAILGLPDIQDPIGIAGILWDKAELLCTMLDDPECVFELTDKIYGLTTAFLDEWFRRYGNRFCAHYPHYVMNRGISVSVDEVGIVSPELFRTFFAENLDKLSERYGGIGIHCCALSEHQFENFSKVRDLKLMNLYRPTPSRKKAYEVFRTLCVQCHGDYLSGIPRYIGPEEDGIVPRGSRVIYREPVDSLEEAQRKCDLYAKRFR